MAATGPRPAEAARVFGKLGLIAFGGPAVHVALLRREVVERRRWISEAEFLRMFAACNMIPGPSSTELAIYLGYRLCGWAGMAAAGLFIIPAAILMTAIGWAYGAYGSGAVAQALLSGIRPVVVGIVLWAAYQLGRSLVRGLVPAVVAVLGGAAFLVGVHPIAVLAAGGLAGLAATRERATPAPQVVAGATAGLALGKLASILLTFIKIGALTLGSGYVLLAFLRADVVGGMHIVTDRQLVDAIAIGQATPGPVFTTATLLGYLAAGVPGAVAATLGIFAPGFVFIPFLERAMRWVDRRPAAGAFLAGANAAALGLIVAVTLQLGRVSITRPLDVALAAVALGVSFFRPAAGPLLVLGGAAAGLLAHVLVP